MAFSLPNYTDPATGAAITYFVITGLSLDLVNQAFTVYVNGYVNQADYAAGLAPVPPAGNMSFLVNGSLYSQFLSVLTTQDIPVGSPQATILQELLAQLAQNMLTLPFFSGATIVS